MMIALYVLLLITTATIAYLLCVVISLRSKLNDLERTLDLERIWHETALKSMSQNRDSRGRFARRVK